MAQNQYDGQMGGSAKPDIKAGSYHQGFRNHMNDHMPPTISSQLVTSTATTEQRSGTTLIVGGTGVANSSTPQPKIEQESDSRMHLIPPDYKSRRGAAAREHYPFECGVCGPAKRFLYRDSARKHYRQHHGLPINVIIRYEVSPRPMATQPRRKRKPMSTEVQQEQVSDTIPAVPNMHQPMVTSLTPNQPKSLVSATQSLIMPSYNIFDAMLDEYESHDQVMFANAVPFQIPDQRPNAPAGQIPLPSFDTIQLPIEVAEQMEFTTIPNTWMPELRVTETSTEQLSIWADDGTIRWDHLQDNPW